MKTLKLTSAWILICSITAVSTGPSEHASSHHVVQHGASTLQKILPDTPVPSGVQIPDHVLSTQDVSCISADNNIFQIMHEAQNACNGTDMRCTFYHFANHDYQNIGTLNVNKELFDDLLMKFDNWLLTAESIDKTRVIGKTNEHSPINTTSIHKNDKNEDEIQNPTNTTELNNVHTNQGKLDDNISESDVDRFHSHHIKNPDETHHRNHHHKLKNGNHVKPYTEFNKEHKYFEVFLPKDRETGKPRTIYVEIDKDKNEFVLLDEDIDKKLNGIKPIKIELDELSEIADTAFGSIVKSVNHKGHIHNNINNDNQVTVNELNTDSALDKSELPLNLGKYELENILNSSVCDPHIFNSNANKQPILNNDMENVSKNHIVPNKYINQEEFHVELQSDNTTKDMINNNFEILQNINETDTHEYEKESFDTVEFDHNNITDIDIDTDYLELNSSQDFIKLPCENEDDNCREHYDFSTDHDIDTYDDNDFIQLEENNYTSTDTDFDEAQEFLSSEMIDLNEPVLQDFQPVQETKLKTTPYKPKLTSSLTDGILDYNSAQLHLLPPENQKAPIDLHDHSSVSNVPINPFTEIPIPGKELANVVETDSQSSFPEYSTTDLIESGSHNPISNFDLHVAVSPRDYILPLTNKKFSDSPKSISPDLSISTKDSSIFQIAPSFNIDVQEPYCTAPFQLGVNTPMSMKNTILPSKFALPKPLSDFHKITTTNQFDENPLSVIPYSLQQIPPNLIPTKDNLGLVKCLPMDNDIKETMIPCSANKNQYPCNTIPYITNPYLKPPQLIPSYYEPSPQVIPLQPPKIPTLDSLPISMDQSNLCFNADYPQETKPIPLLPFAPCTPFSSLNPLWLEPGSFPSTCPNLWNSIPHQTVPSLPYTILPAQNLCNILSNYLAPNVGQQQNQILKPLQSKEVPKSVLQLPCECATKNIQQMTPSSNTLYSPIYTRPMQIDFNPSQSLERDLQALSYKYGIPLTKILNALDAEISGNDNPISWLPFELPRSKFVSISSLNDKSTTNSAVFDKNRTGDNKDLVESDLRNLTPLDSTLIGPHLEIEDSLLLSPNDFQTHAVASESPGLQSNQYLNSNKKTDNKHQDSSFIGSQLSTLATSDIKLSDEDRMANVELHQESDSSNLVPLETSLIGPHLEISRPQVVLDSNIYKTDILTSYKEVPVTSPSQIKTKLNQNHLTSSSPDNYLTDLHLKTVSPTKPLLNDEIQITNEMIPLESDITELTPLDLLHVDRVNDLKQSDILKHENTTKTVDTTILYEPVETESNFIEGELVPESNSPKLIPLDSSLIGPHLHASEDRSDSLKSHDNIENTDIKFDEMENIILPSSMLTKLLSKPVNADLNLNTNTKLNNLLEMNLELPITESSSITSSSKETDFQIIEPNLEITDSTILEDQSKSADITLEANSEIQLDSSLIGPNLLQESDSRDMSQILDSVDHLETYKVVPTSNLNKKPSNILAAIDSKTQFDSSLTGLNLFQEMKPHALDTMIELDDSFVRPDLQETIESSATSSLSEATHQLHSSIKGTLKPESDYRAFDSNNVLDTSLVGPHLLTTPFSNDEIKMINQELQLQSELANLKPLDSSLIGPHLDFESQLDKSEISRYYNPESSSLIEGGPSLKPINMPSDLQELLSKFTNAITKSHLSPSEIKPCDKLLSSLSSIASDNSYIELPCEGLQEELAFEYHPLKIIPEQEISPVEFSTKGKACYNSNYSPIPMMSPEYAYTKGVPQLPFIPLVDRNWLKQPPYNQNVHQASPGLRPIVQNSPFTSENFNLLLDLVSQNKLYPQSSNPYMNIPGETIVSSLVSSTPSNVLPLSNYSPLLPKKSFTALPCNTESTVSNPEYNPVVVDDIMSLMDEDTHQLLKDMSILPSMTPTIPTFGNEIVSPTLLGTIPVTNADFTKPRPCNSPYSNIPLGTQFSETIDPPPKLISLPTESPNVPLSQWYKIPNKLQFIDSIENLKLGKEYVPQFLTQPYLDSPIILPSSALESMLQIPTASNKLNSIPCQMRAVNFSPIQTPLSNEIMSSILQSYAKPLSVSYAKPISYSSTSFPFNPASLAPSTLSFIPCTASPIVPEISSPLTSINIEPSDNLYVQTAAYNKPISSSVIYKPSLTYSNPCLPVHTSPLPFDNSPYSQTYESKTTPAVRNPYLVKYVEPMSASYFSPIPKCLTNLDLPLTPIPPIPVEPMQIGLLSPSYVSPVTPSHSYLPIPTHTLKQSSSILLPAYSTPISPKTSSLTSNLICLPSELKYIQNPQIIKQKPQLMKPINVKPIFLDNNLLLNANQKLPISPNTDTPIPSYFTHVPKSLPISSQIKQNVPCGEVMSNLQTSFLTNEVPAFEVKKENICTHSNDEDNYYYESSVPLESMSYTLAPEHTTENFTDEDFVNQEDLNPFDPITSVATEPLTKTNLYQRPLPTHYTPLYSKPGISHLPSPPLTELIQPNIFDNVLPMPSLKPYQASLPTSIQSGQFLKHPIPVTSAPNLSLLLSPYTSAIPCNIVPINQEPLLSLPNYFESSQNMPMSPITPLKLVSPINLPISQPPTLSAILDNFIQLPPTHFDPKSKTLTSQRPSSSMPCCNQYIPPIIPHFMPIEEPSPNQYITPLSLPKSGKLLRPVFTPKYKCSVLSAPTKFQDGIPLSEAPIHYQTYNPPAALPNSVKNTFVPSANSPYTIPPFSNNIVEPLSIDLNKPQWLSISPQYALPATLSSPIPVSSSAVPFPTIKPVIAPQTAKQALTNHIIPSSLFFMPSNLQVPCNKHTSHYNTPRYSLPSPTLTVPLETFPCETLSKPLKKTVRPQNILKPNRQFSSGQFKVPLPSSPYLTQPVESTEYYPVQPSPNIQYTAKTHPKLSPVASYSPLRLETIPHRLINGPSIPQYSLPIVPVYDASNQPLSAKNPFSYPNFKPILEVPSYHVPNNLISSPKITPFDSILLSNLQPLDISKECLDSYSSPLTPSVPLYSSGLTKFMPQKSRQYKPQEVPNYSQYVSQLPIESVSELLPSTNPLLKNPILKPLLTSSQNNIPLCPIHFSSLYSAFPDKSPSTSKYEYSSSFTPLAPEIAETVAPINVSPKTSNSLLKPRLNKYYQSPVSLTNMPLISNYDIVESPAKIPMKTNIVNTAKPVEVTDISASELSPQYAYSLDSEVIEEIKPYEHRKEKFLATDRASSLPMYLNQQRKVHPAHLKYLTMPQSPHSTIPLSKYNNLRPTLSLSEGPEEVEEIDTTNFIPLSQLKSDPLVVDYTPADREAPIFKYTPSVEPDTTQFSPYTTLSNTNFPPSKPKPLLSKLETSRYSNQVLANLPVYLSPQEYKDLIQGPSIQGSSSSTNFFTSANTEPQLTISPMTVGTRPLPIYTSPISFKPNDWLQPPILAKSLPHHEIPIEVAPEKENIQTFLNKYKLHSKISPVGINNYPYEVISEIPQKQDTVKPIPLRKSGPNTEYDVIELNDFNEYDSEMIPYELEPKNIEVRDNKPNGIEAKSFAEISPEIIKGSNVPTYNDVTHRPQKLSKLDHFYANNHIGKCPQVFTVPAYKKFPIDPSADVKTVYNASPNILNDFSNLPTDFEDVPKLESSSLKSSEFQPGLVHSPKKIPKNYLHTCLKPYSQREFPPNTIELANTLEMPYQSTSYAPNDNIKDIKYSGYKTYQKPILKSPKFIQNLGTPIQAYDPSVVPYKSPIHSVKSTNIQQIPNTPDFYSPVEIFEPYNPQYLTPVEMKTPLQTKLGLDAMQEIPELEEYSSLFPHKETPLDITTPIQTKLGINNLKESLEFEEYNPIEELPLRADKENEDNEFKTSLLNYINTREDVKNNLYNSNTELTIPIGNIAITKKEPYNANTIDTNNPSIGLKVWKSNVKIAQAELKLKFKDLSVNNFMPVVNNLDEYDMGEIRKIVKNYIDDKYGAHIEVNEPYTIDNEYAVIKDFDHNAVDNKYNLLWPTNYV